MVAKIHALPRPSLGMKMTCNQSTHPKDKDERDHKVMWVVEKTKSNN